MTGKIFAIERFCVHDGPGIRTGVFFKGCPLRCVWCHNPESREEKPTLSFTEKECTVCRLCERVCPSGAHRFENGRHSIDRSLCTGCGRCCEACTADALKLWGRSVTVEEVMEVIRKDGPYYGRDGGVTLSGGEPLMQPDFAGELLRRCREENITICVETAGCVPEKAFAAIVEDVDLFLYDYKLSCQEDMDRYTGGSLKLVRSNLEFLAAHKKNIILRCPVIPGINDTDRHFRAAAALAERVGALGLELMPYHSYGAEKWIRAGLSCELDGLPTVSEKEAAGYRKRLNEIRTALKADMEIFMKQTISRAEVTLRRQKAGALRLPFAERKTEGNTSDFRFESDGITACVTISEQGQVLTGRVNVSLKNEAFRENDNLAEQEPVRLSLSFSEKPRRMTAMYLHRDWWTRPAFIRDFQDIPARTQCLFMEYEGFYGCLMLLSGDQFKAEAEGSMEGPDIVLTAYRGGQSGLNETVFFLACAQSLYEAVHLACARAARLNAIPLKEQKSYPAIFEYLGWCSWDAFYTDINEEKVRKKVDELKEKRVPVRWILMDDGWLSVRDNRLYGLEPDKKKFPEGFSKLIEELKADGQILNAGVWHALGGYWGGVETGSTAALGEADHLYRTVSGKLLPYPEAERGYGFYRDWYELLRKEGIDFVKVDGQSAVKNYYEGQISVCEAARQCHRALEGAAAAYMGGRLINCMGMAMENVLGRPGSAMSRNSDDFVPDNPDGFAEHLLQNAWNAVYHDEFYYCDWDMFWTSHPDAQKHAVLRAISGGPVYCSDRIGETDADAARPLVYEDGRILRMERAAKPSADCLFTDPAYSGPIKLTNLYGCSAAGKKGGATAVFNLSPKDGKVLLSAADIHDLPKGDYYCYDWLQKTGRRLYAEEGFPVTLPPGGYGLYLFVPMYNDTAALGLIDKYISFHAVESVWETDGSFSVLLKQAGEFAFYRERPVTRVTVNGNDRTLCLRMEQGLYRLTAEGDGKILVTVE